MPSTEWVLNKSKLLLLIIIIIVPHESSPYAWLT